MKKLFIFATCAIATIATAETFKGGADVDHRTPITAPSSPSNALVLDPSTGTFYSGINETTYKSVSSTGKVGMASGGLTIDANTTEDNFKAFDVAGDWSMNKSYLFITNNAENNTATVEINANRFVFTSGTDQSQTMSIGEGKYTINTTGTSIFSADQGTATLEIFRNEENLILKRMLHQILKGATGNGINAVIWMRQFINVFRFKNIIKTHSHIS